MDNFDKEIRNRLKKVMPRVEEIMRSPDFQMRKALIRRAHETDEEYELSKDYNADDHLLRCEVPDAPSPDGKDYSNSFALADDMRVPPHQAKAYANRQLPANMRKRFSFTRYDHDRQRYTTIIEPCPAKQDVHDWCSETSEYYNTPIPDNESDRILNTNEISNWYGIEYDIIVSMQAGQFIPSSPVLDGGRGKIIAYVSTIENVQRVFGV